MKNKNTFRFIRIVFYFICFIYLLIKEPNGESLIIICPTRNLFDFNCYLCGMTRAFICSFHLLFIDAIIYNPLVIIIYPIFLFISIQDTFITLKDLILKKESKSFLEFIINK